MIIKNLIEILKNEDTVYINDIGLFKKQHESAKMVGDRLFPPQNRLLFEQTDEGNGFAFTLFVSRAENLRIVDADLQVRAWVEQLKTTLNQDGVCQLNGFGTFHKNGGKLTFEAEYIPELNIAFEGMEVLDIQPVTPKIEEPKTAIAAEPKIEEPKVEVKEKESEIIEQSEQEIKPAIEEKIEVEEKELEVKVEPQLSDNQQDTEEIETPEQLQQSSKKSSHWVGNLLFVLLILGTLTLLAYLFREPLVAKYQEVMAKFRNETPAQVAPENAVDSIAAPIFDVDTLATDSTFANIDTLGIVETPDPAPSHSAVATSTQNSENFPIIDFEKGKFYLIAGSLNNDSEAISHAKTKQKQGFTPQILHQSGTSRVRVCVAIFDNEADATAFQKQHQNLWILQ